MQALRRFLLFFSVFLFATSAFGQSAAELKKEGDAAFLARRYSDAITAYDKAYATGHDAAVLYNKARSHEALEQYPEALAALEKFSEEASPAVRAKVSGLSTLINEIRSRVATLVVKANVEGARVTLRGVEIGKTSKDSLRVQIVKGRGALVVEKEGYAPFKQDVDLPGESSTIINAILETKAATASVKITTNPPRSSVTIDGRAVGASPVELDLTPKSHTIEIEREGYDKLQATVSVEADKPRTFDFELHESPSILSRWWFWTGIGVVVAGGVVLTFVALKEKDAPAGTIAPGTVGAPLVVWR